MQKLKNEIIDLLNDMGVPGAIVSIKSKLYGNWSLSYGYADLEYNIPMNQKLPFRIGSITKTFSGTMFLQLYDEKKVKLDVPVFPYLLGIPNGKNIPIRSIGNMRSGIFNYSESPDFDSVLTEFPQRTWVSDELLALGVSNKPYFPPNTDFHYSNTNTVILELIGERIDETTYEDSLKKRILEPLKLKETYYSARIKQPSMQGYAYTDGEWVNVTNNNASWAWDAGELISTVSDMHKYLKRSIINHETLSADAAKQQRKWASEHEVRPGIIIKYGFQLEKINTFIGHNGSIPGYNSYILHSLKTDASIVVVCNTQNSESSQSPADEIIYLILKYLK